MQGCDVRNQRAPREWKVQVVDMVMNHIELVRALRYLLQHQNVVRHPIDAAIAQAKRAAAWSNEPRSRYRVTAREQSHVVPLANQFLGKIRNDPFGPSIMFRRHTLGKRRYLCDSHIVPLLPGAIRLSLRATEAECACITKSGVCTTVINRMIYFFLSLPVVSRSQVRFALLK